MPAIISFAVVRFFTALISVALVPAKVSDISCLPPSVSAVKALS